MTPDIFDFWSEVGPADRTHPRDRAVLDRISHKLDLRCLPGCFEGPLRTARLVLLYLAPGFDERDLEDAESPEGRMGYVQQRTGRYPFPSRSERPALWTWWRARTKWLGEEDTLRDEVAVLNIGAYHAAEFKDGPLLAALPSSRMSIGWAQDVLFPQAMAGERVVICLRSARYWGLDKGKKHGQGLFAPNHTRGGHMLKNDPTQAEAKRAALEIIRRPR